MARAIEGKLAAHDRYRFELKLGYSLNPEKPRNKYNIDLYFFIPKSLGVNGANYQKNDFYEDIQGYIRFKTPLFTFDDLIDPKNLASPLTRLSKLIALNPNRQKLITELKLSACTIRVSLRNSITLLRNQIKKQEVKILKESVSNTCDRLSDCLKTLRGMKPDLSNPAIHEDVRTAFRHIDEYLCIMVDGLLNSLHNSILAASLGSELTQELNGVITPFIINEFNYRKSNGYVVYDQNSDNELFLYRKGFLKKIVNNILFLDTHTQEGIYAAKDFIFAIAAGIAMVIATAVTVWAGMRYGSTSIPFVLAIVVGYMAKDRIKDWCKLVFSNKMTRWLSDYKTKILDPESEKQVGVCKHAFSYLTENKIPKDILELRRHKTPSDFWVEEDIIKYEKDIIINPAPIVKTHKRLRDITDIIRFNIHHFLERMDEPFEIRRSIDPNTGNIAEFRCARVYHVNMILKLEEETRRIRLVLNKNGILRIEEVV